MVSFKTTRRDEWPRQTTIPPQVALNAIATNYGVDLKSPFKDEKTSRARAVAICVLKGKYGHSEDKIGLRSLIAA